MTVGAVHTFFMTPGIRVPRWNRSAMYYSHGVRGVDRYTRSSFCFADTTGKTPPLRVQGARTTADGRRVQSSLELTTTKAEVGEMTSPILRGMFSPGAKKSVESLPLRPALAKAKQVPGRYFPKAIMSEDQKAVMESVKPSKPDFLDQSARFPPIKGLEFIKTSIALLAPTPPNKPVRASSFNRKIAHTRKSRRVLPEFHTEVFAISFQADTRGAYDPNSELHSDYYSITRLNINSAKDAHAHTAKSHVRVPTSNSGDFRIVLRGKRKLLHGRSEDSAHEPEVIPRIIEEKPESTMRSARNVEELESLSRPH